MEKIGTIIRNHRIEKSITQEELGEQIFVSKQAVSKWENGKAVPDIETIRKLCVILEISNEEILGGSIKENKQNRKKLKTCLVITVICILITTYLALFALDGIGYISRHFRSGVTYLTVYYNGDLLETTQYTVASELYNEDLKNAYKLDSDYGTVRGIIDLYNEYEIEFGFFNGNNWHNVNITLEVNSNDGQLFVKQTICFETDNKHFVVIENEEISSDNKTTVYMDGIWY